MSRNRGIINSVLNYEILAKEPLDARNVVETKIDLTNPTTWIDSNNDVWLYNGILVSVVNDPITDNNGLYLLQDVSNYTLSSGWVKFSTGSSNVENVGSGTGLIYRDNSGGFINLRTLTGSGSIDVSTMGDMIILSVDTSYAGVGTGLNIGIGDVSIFNNRVLDYLEFRTIKGSSDIIVKYYDANTITIDTSLSQDSSISNIYNILNLITPSKPGNLSGTTLNCNISIYSAILPNGLNSRWYTGSLIGGNVSDYVVSDVFTLTTPNYPNEFYAGMYSDPSSRGVLTAILSGNTGPTYNMNNGLGSTMIATSDVSGSINFVNQTGYGGIGSNFWDVAQANISVTSQNYGYFSYAISHSLSGITNALGMRYDPSPGIPYFSVNPSINENVIQWKYLSGIKYYGLNSTFNVSFTAGSGIFRNAYATNVGAISSIYGNTINVNPSTIPYYFDTFIVTNKLFAFDVPNVNSSTNNAAITTRIFKPTNVSSSYTNTLSHRANTYGIISTLTSEYFYDEDKRLLSASSSVDSSWNSIDSSIFLSNGPYAQVRNGFLEYPVSADYNNTIFSGDKQYVRRFTKSGLQSSGTLTFNGFNPSSNLSKYGSGNTNMLIWLTDQGLYFDLAKPFNPSDPNDGSSELTAKGAYIGSLGINDINWSLGTYSLALETTHKNQFVLITIFKNNSNYISQIILS